MGKQGERGSGDAVMQLGTTGWVQPVTGAVCMVMGVCTGLYLHRAASSVQEPIVMTLFAAGFTGFGAWLAARRTSVVLDRDTMQVTVRWRWLFLGGKEVASARGKALAVERTIHRSREGSSESFAVVLDRLQLRKVTEMEGGAEAAAALARRMADHLGIPYSGQRDSAATRRAEARRAGMARYAMVPLLIVVASMLLMFVYMTLVGPPG